MEVVQVRKENEALQNKVRCVTKDHVALIICHAKSEAVNSELTSKLENLKGELQVTSEELEKSKILVSQQQAKNHHLLITLKRKESDLNQKRNDLETLESEIKTKMAEASVLKSKEKLVCFPCFHIFN